jgi:cobalt-zinc-cadmium efflux system protein
VATDAIVLATGLVATAMATRPDRTGRRTYGSYRAEVLASGLAVLLMCAVGIWVGLGGLGRIGAHPEIASAPMVVVGLLGLGVNAACLTLLRHGARRSLTVRAAYLEVIADAAGSVGVLVAGALVSLTGNPLWDTLIAVAIGGFVLVRAASLGRQVLAVLNQQVPSGMDPERVAADLAAVPGVSDVHDLHLWTLTSGMHVATAHLVARDGADQHAVLDTARDVLRQRHGISHATLQVEPASHRGCSELSW